MGLLEKERFESEPMQVETEGRTVSPLPPPPPPPPLIPKPLPFPSRLEEKKKRDDKEFIDFLKMFKALNVNLPLLELLEKIHKYAKFLKDVMSRWRKIGRGEQISLNKECNAPRCRINLMPFSICMRLGLGELKGFLEDVLVRVRTTIDVGRGELTMKIEGEIKVFKCFEIESRCKERKRIYVGTLVNRQMKRYIRVVVEWNQQGGKKRKYLDLQKGNEAIYKGVHGKLGGGAIQWPTRSSDSFEGEDNEGEAESTKGKEKVEATDDDELEGREITPRDETMEEATTSTGYMSEGVDPRE
ncbi:hypothetical protein Goshw_005580 [Gossypium schwendimanii]|uniref:Uncharacterized protein n=1 Tax=Gossypium schwendimanii TaxID=34291 RepID=A0A7J9KJP1_GOSSC|nr:hypothetical protein [Gossypium schwendimanii]